MLQASNPGRYMTRHCHSHRLIIMLPLFHTDNTLHWCEIRNFLVLFLPVRRHLDKGNKSLYSIPPPTPIPIKWSLNPFRTSNHSNRELILPGHSMKGNQALHLSFLDHSSSSSMRNNPSGP